MLNNYVKIYVVLIDNMIGKYGGFYEVN